MQQTLTAGPANNVRQGVKPGGRGWIAERPTANNARFYCSVPRDMLVSLLGSSQRQEETQSNMIELHLGRVDVSITVWGILRMQRAGIIFHGERQL